MIGMIALLMCACSAPTEPPTGTDEAFDTSTNTNTPAGAADEESETPGAVSEGDTEGDATTTTTTGSGDEPGDETPGQAPITAAAILAKLSSCTKVSASPYAKDSGGTANIDVCKHGDVVYVNADMDIDCDGKTTAVCNKTADPSYLASTAANDSTGKPLDASTLPYVVVPGVSSRWSYKTSGIGMGTVVAVIYNGKIEYGVVGDIGPTSIIGEASYAMAQSLGINPNPKTGGISSGVTYVFFPGTKVSKIEDHASAVTMGEARAHELLDN